MLLFLFRGILIGLVFGIPVGAVGVLTIQRTFESGIKAGLFTGLGSSVADCIYASIGAFGLTFLLAFSWFGIAGQMGIKESILLVAGVFIGTYFWWSILAFGTDLLKRKSKVWNAEKLNKLFGIVLTIIGGIILIGFFLE